LYPPHRSHLHPLSLSFSSTTLPSLQNTELGYLFLSLHVIIMSWHWVQHIQSTAYTKYSIHQVQYILSSAYTKYSIHQVQHPPQIVCLPYILRTMSWPLNLALASSMPPYTIDCYQPALHESWKVKLPCTIPTIAS
jgi:hypothetical protein